MSNTSTESLSPPQTSQSWKQQKQFSREDCAVKGSWRILLLFLEKKKKVRKVSMKPRGFPSILTGAWHQPETRVGFVRVKRPSVPRLDTIHRRSQLLTWPRTAARPHNTHSGLHGPCGSLAGLRPAAETSFAYGRDAKPVGPPSLSLEKRVLDVVRFPVSRTDTQTLSHVFVPGAGEEGHGHGPRRP